MAMLEKSIAKIHKIELREGRKRLTARLWVRNDSFHTVLSV